MLNHMDFMFKQKLFQSISVPDITMTAHNALILDSFHLSIYIDW